MFTRLLTTDILTAIAWRSFFGGLFLAIVHIAIHRRRSLRAFAGIGLHGLAFMLCQVVCQACTVGAFYLTTIADVTIIYATAPFIAAGIAWWLLGERLQRRTLLAGLASLFGTLVIIAGSLGGGHLIGDLLAIGMTLSFAVVIVIPRARRGMPTLPATILSAFITFGVFAPLSAPSALDAHDWFVLAAFGLNNFPIALFLFIAGARLIPSAQAALIGTLELVFAPAWVWLAFGEAPGQAALIGGAVNFAAVVWHTLAEDRSFRRTRI